MVRAPELPFRMRGYNPPCNRKNAKPLKVQSAVTLRD